jgi:hypothetical protein
VAYVHDPDLATLHADNQRNLPVTALNVVQQLNVV